MTTALIRPSQLYAWKGSSLLIVNTRGAAVSDDSLCGFYYRETRVLRTCRLTIDGREPWLCEAAQTSPDALAFTFNHPELTTFGGGGSGQSGDEDSTDEAGVPHRALTLILTYRVDVAGLRAELCITNHARRAVDTTIAWQLDADFADILEAHENKRQQQAEVRAEEVEQGMRFSYAHSQLRYVSTVTGDISTPLHLGPQQSVVLQWQCTASDHVSHALKAREVAAREDAFASWQESFTRIACPRNPLAETIVASNVRDMASFAILDGQPDEWLALQAGVPLYPAVFGRDTLTAGWQAAFIDHGRSLESSLTYLERLQSDRVYDPRDEEPGRIPYQMRRGPLAQLGINPYLAYYADFASPLMFVISLGHLYAWTGDTRCVERHWDTIRRILEWARTYGDKDQDGYLEYETKSPDGTKNQGWKDSGDAIIYADGSPVQPPIATCELQGYWFAAQQVAAVLSAVMGAPGDARAHWRSASDLKARFNRDWWDASDHFVALALDPGKRQVCARTSNVGHCVASGIVSDEHLPAVVGRLFAPDMFSGWGIRTLSTEHRYYNPLSYHRGTVWAVEQATIAFGLRRFGFDTRAQELAEGMFALAQLYPDYRIPECVGGFARGANPTPGAYPRANTPQLWNASAFALLLHTMLGLQPIAPLGVLVCDPALPSWLPDVELRGLRIGSATANVRFWRDEHGRSHAELMNTQGTLRLIRQQPPESLSAGLTDRFRALFDAFL